MGEGTRKKAAKPLSKRAAKAPEPVEPSDDDTDERSPAYMLDTDEEHEYIDGLHDMHGIYVGRIHNNQTKFTYIADRMNKRFYDFFEERKAMGDFPQTEGNPYRKWSWKDGAGEEADNEQEEGQDIEEDVEHGSDSEEADEEAPRAARTPAPIAKRSRKSPAPTPTSTAAPLRLSTRDNKTFVMIGEQLKSVMTQGQPSADVQYKMHQETMALTQQGMARECDLKEKELRWQMENRAAEQQSQLWVTNAKIKSEMLREAAELSKNGMPHDLVRNIVQQALALPTGPTQTYFAPQPSQQSQQQHHYADAAPAPQQYNYPVRAAPPAYTPQPTDPAVHQPTGFRPPQPNPAADFNAPRPFHEAGDQYAG